MRLAARLRNVPALKRLVPSLMKARARRKWPNGWTVAEAHGGLFLLNWRNYVDRQLLFFDDFEDEQLDRFIGGMKERGCTAFLDVGANIGYYTVVVAQAHPCWIVAFEPDPRNLQQLRANLFLNRMSERVEVRAEAASDAPGQVSFEVWPDGSTGQSRVSDKGTLSVPAVRLDDVLDFKGQSLAIKMDIEGYEQVALAGMTRLLADNDCWIQLESFGHNLPAVTALLESLGYRKVATIADDHFFAR